MKTENENVTPEGGQVERLVRGEGNGTANILTLKGRDGDLRMEGTRHALEMLGALITDLLANTPSPPVIQAINEQNGSRITVRIVCP